MCIEQWGKNKCGGVSHYFKFSISFKTLALKKSDTPGIEVISNLFKGLNFFIYFIPAFCLDWSVVLSLYLVMNFKQIVLKWKKNLFFAIIWDLKEV